MATPTCWLLGGPSLCHVEDAWAPAVIITSNDVSSDLAVKWAPPFGGLYKGGLLGFLSTISCTIASAAGHKNVTVTDQMETRKSPSLLDELLYHTGAL